MRNIIILTIALVVFLAIAQQDVQVFTELDSTSIRNYAPKLYLDCSWCYSDYLKDEITFVNYVRERTEADVHLLITVHSTSSGGREYTLEFIGQNDYSGLHYTLKYSSGGTATTDEVRSGLAHTIKMGLMPFVERTPLKDYVKINYNVGTEVENREVVDKWKNWVFSVGASGYTSGESQSSFISLHSSVSIKKITEEQKITSYSYVNYSENRYDIDNDIVKSISRNYGVSGEYVKSLGEHFAIGGEVEYRKNKYSNIQFGFSMSPGVEYNIFPYSEYSKHKLTIHYTISAAYHDYYEETIYEKFFETLFSERLSCYLSIIKQWGSANISISGSHYFHNLSLNHLGLSAGTSVRLFAGFSFNVSGGVSLIHDQISLPRADATTEEILLRQRQLETQYSYWSSIGISYTFGSIYSNVVNPRF